MKKTLIISALTLAAVAAAHAESKLYSDLPDTLTGDSMVYANTFNQTSANKDAIGFQDAGSFAGSDTLTSVVVGNTPDVRPWTTSLNYTSGLTISADLGDVQGGAWADVLMFNTGGGTGNPAHLQLNNSGELYVYLEAGFAGLTSGDNRNIRVGATSELTGHTITISYSAADMAVKAYVDGALVGSHTWTADDCGANPSTAVTGIQLGSQLGGTRKIGSAELDNVYIWNEALSDAQVASIMKTNDSGNTDSIPEPATATLSLLALAGLAARRRRK